jgi:hypothetical protein
LDIHFKKKSPEFQAEEQLPAISCQLPAELLYFSKYLAILQSTLTPVPHTSTSAGHLVHRFSLLLLAVLALHCAHTPYQTVNDGLASVTPALMRQHVTFLASDSLKGRNTPSPGLDTAASYIMKEFRRNGFLPLGGDYRQPVHLCIVSLGSPNSLRITAGGTLSSFAIKTDFTPFEMTASKEVNGGVVFCGYGITAPEYHYDDYAGMNVKGKIVVVLRHEPREEDSASVFAGKRATDYSNVARKVTIARAHGAVGVMVITDPLNHTSLSPRGFPWPSLSKFLPQDALPMTLGSDEEEKLPVVHIGESVIASLFGSVEALRNIQAHIDSAMAPQSRVLENVTADLQTTTSVKVLPASNIAGFLEGADPLLKNQIVVVGAHYDHVGMGHATSPGQDVIFNGADDNGSGTSALMGVAAAFHGAGIRPARSVLLIAFCGEEKGLLGSEAYVRHPLLPLDSTVAMINLDMVGRNGRDSLYIIGGGTAPDLMRIVLEENARIGFTLIDERVESGGSDHMSFQKKNIPAIFFFSGTHKDYHQVTDHADLINNDKVAAASRLAFLTCLRLANDPHRYKLVH